MHASQRGFQARTCAARSLHGPEAFESKRNEQTTCARRCHLDGCCGPLRTAREERVSLRSDSQPRSAGVARSGDRELATRRHARSNATRQRVSVGQENCTDMRAVATNYGATMHDSRFVVEGK